MVPGKQPVPAEVPVTDVIRGMAGRMHGLEHEVCALDAVAVGDDPVRQERRVLVAFDLAADMGAEG